MEISRRRFAAATLAALVPLAGASAIAARAAEAPAVPEPYARLVAALARYKRARDLVCEISDRFDMDEPRALITPAEKARSGRAIYADDEAQILQLIDVARHLPSAEKQVARWEAVLADFRAQKAAYEREYEACGIGAAERDRAAAWAEYEAALDAYLDGEEAAEHAAIGAPLA